MPRSKSSLSIPASSPSIMLFANSDVKLFRTLLTISISTWSGPTPELWGGQICRSKPECSLCWHAASVGASSPLQVKAYAEAAIGLGISKEAVVETVLQTLPIAGFPAVTNALLNLRDTVAVHR